MLSVEDRNVFKQYYQANYDFNTSSLDEQEINKIKQIAKQRRVNYALAPIGEKIFSFIAEQNPNLQFELVDLDTERIDAMLYIPTRGEDKAYIVINKEKPLINQIFAAAHEYYHYIEDYESIKAKPYVCCLSSLINLNEKKASRFAAELLLPEEALKNEIRLFRMRFGMNAQKALGIAEYGSISTILTLKYQMPLKAVIYRLCEEKYINNVDSFIQKYDVIKSVLLNMSIVKDSVEHLYSTTNHILEEEGFLYQQIEKAYMNGLASRDEIIEDAKYLQLNTEVIQSFFDILEEEEEDTEDEELKIISEKWGN